MLYSTDHSIQFTRNTEGFAYTFEGKRYKFYPDFIVDGGYVEVKGWLDAKNKAKITQFDRPLIVLGKAEMKPLLSYAIKTYGDDFVNMYGGESGNRTRL